MIIYLDKATGNNKERENLKLLLKIIEPGDLIVIKSIDRLSRNYKEVMQLWDQITSTGADILVIDMSILDTRQHKDLLGNFVSNLILQVLAYVSEQETEFRRKRQMEGIAAAKARGKVLGRPNITYPPLWDMYYLQWKSGGITAKEFMESVNLKRTTFYKLIKRYTEENK